MSYETLLLHYSNDVCPENYDFVHNAAFLKRLYYGLGVFCLSFIVCIVEEGFHSTAASLWLLRTEELDTQALSRSALSTLCGRDWIRLDWQWPGKHAQTSHQLSSHFDSSVANSRLELDITFSQLRPAHFNPVKGAQTQTQNMEIPHVKQPKLLQVYRKKKPKTHHSLWEAEAEKIGFQGR